MVSVIQLRCPSSVAFLHCLRGQSGWQAGLQMPGVSICKSAGPFASSLLHEKVALSVFTEYFDEVLDAHQETVCLWIHTLPLDKLLSLCVCLPLLSFFFFSVLSVLTANLVSLRLSPRSICTTQCEEISRSYISSVSV